MNRLNVALLILALATLAAPAVADGPPALAPIDPSEWDLVKARHLLNRAGFGGSPHQIAALATLSFDEAVDHLLRYDRQPAFEAFVPRPLKPADERWNRLRAIAARAYPEQIA